MFTKGKYPDHTWAELFLQVDLRMYFRPAAAMLAKLVVWSWLLIDELSHANYDKCEQMHFSSLVII